MPSKQHLGILKKGVQVWNRWREANPNYRPNLSKIKLINVNLSHVNLGYADLTDVDFNGVDLHEANLDNANLTGANLSRSDLHKATIQTASLHNSKFINADLSESSLAESSIQDANLEFANLSGAYLFRTTLTRTNLIRANLSGANLQGASLSDIDLSDSNLSGANLFRTGFTRVILNRSNLQHAMFHMARLEWVTFGGNDLSQVRGLDSVFHDRPSIIGVDTIYLSHGNIPEEFLRGVGIPDSFITYARSLSGQAIDFYSCFISYSSINQDFADRLYSDLQNSGVRCWFAPEDLKIGEKFRERIDESIRLYDKLLLILSEESIQSVWVEEEVEAALERERREGKLVLFPISIDDAVQDSDRAWAASLRRMRHIGDFKGWKNHDAYQKSFKLLLRDLKATEEYPKRA